MKKALLLLLGLFKLMLPAQAQQVSQVNFDLIKADIQQATSPFHYPALLTRFQAADTTLTKDDFMHLYYGQVFASSYNPYSDGLDEEFIKVYNKKEYAKAVTLGEKAIAANPLSLKMLFKMLVSQHELGNMAAAKTYAFRYFGLIRAITASGDGKSIATAYVVAAVPDEYQVLYTMELQSSRQALVGQTDVLTTRPENAPTAPTSKMYFNVSQPLAYLSRSFKGK